MRYFLGLCGHDSNRQDAHNISAGGMCRQTWPQCKEWRARNHAELQLRRGRCGPLSSSEPPEALGVDPSKSRSTVAKLWRCSLLTWKSVSVSVNQRSVPETVDRENELLKSPKFHLVTAAKNGHAAAFDALCHPHTKRLFRRTYRISAKAPVFHRKLALRNALTLRMNYRDGASSLPHNVCTVHRRGLSQE